MAKYTLYVRPYKNGRAIGKPIPAGTNLITGGGFTETKLRTLMKKKIAAENRSIAKKKWGFRLKYHSLRRRK